MAAQLPLLVVSAAPLAGHVNPTIIICRELIKRGFEILFITSQEFKDNVEKIGCEFYETTIWGDDLWEARANFKGGTGIELFLFYMEYAFNNMIPGRAQVMKSALEMVYERDPKRPVVIVNEILSLCPVPFLYGAPPPKGYARFPKTIGVGIVPLATDSIDTAPFGLGLPPDSTESGRMRNQLIYDMMKQGPFKHVIENLGTVLKSCGSTKIPETFPFSAFTEPYDTMLQMCSPSLEYPRSDLHPSIRYAGALPKKGVSPDFKYPEWWHEITENAAKEVSKRKKIIPVAQGTIATKYEELIIPTIKAFAGRDDVIVIAILGAKDAELPADFEAPANARVIDYLPYDAAVEVADVFISNGGYGSVIHGVVNGVPMVVAGQTEDKTEVTALMEHAGFAINLRTQTPTPEAICEAAEKIFANPKYKATAMRLMTENQDMDSITILEREILKYASMWEEES